MEKDVREGMMCSGVLCLECVQFTRGLKQGRGRIMEPWTGTRSSHAGVEVEVESWNVARLVRVSQSARRERETQKVAGSERNGESSRK
jgi:hypothetical protein